MKYKRKFIGIMASLFAFFIFIPIAINVQSYTWETVVVLSGTNDKTTQTFQLTEDAKFVWTTSYDDAEWALFGVFVYPEGETVMYEDYFDGLSGESYFYVEGGFYMKVIVANLNSWQITVQQKNFATTPVTNGGDTELTPTEMIIFAVVSVAIIGGITAIVLVRRKKKQSTPPLQPPVQPPEQLQNVRFCTQCGSKNESSVKYCVNCGASL